MTNQPELVKQVAGKNRLSNLMLCCKTVFDLIPQVLFNPHDWLIFCRFTYERAYLF